jgi:hypothetical protein
LLEPIDDEWRAAIVEERRGGHDLMAKQTTVKVPVDLVVALEHAVHCHWTDLANDADRCRLGNQRDAAHQFDELATDARITLNRTRRLLGLDPIG